MRVVVTRPALSSARTAERLRQLGHDPVLLPLTQALHFPEAAIEALARPHAAMILTSAEAVRALSVARPHSVTDRTVYVVGQATARAAQKAGFDDIRIGPGTGEQLAKFIARHQQTNGPPLLYLAGKPRSVALEEGLAHSGLSVATVEIYEMATISRDPDTVRRALAEPPADAVLLYSSHTARLFFELSRPCAEALQNTRILCLSQAIATATPERFKRNVRVAHSPDEEALMALV